MPSQDGPRHHGDEGGRGIWCVFVSILDKRYSTSYTLGEEAGANSPGRRGAAGGPLPVGVSPPGPSLLVGVGDIGVSCKKAGVCLSREEGDRLAFSGCRQANSLKCLNWLVSCRAVITPISRRSYLGGRLVREPEWDGRLRGGVRL